MKILKNVLYITSPGCTLSVKNRSICVTTKEESRTVPVHNIGEIICFGDMTVTTPFMNFCALNDVKLVFLSCYGKYYGAFYGMQKGNVFLRKAQYKYFDDNEKALEISKSIIDSKLRNSARVIKKSVPDNQNALVKAAEIENIRDQIMEAESIEELRGYEGIAAEKYFSVFDEMIVEKDPEMVFERRTKRPPENNVNSLLSFVYTLLKTDITAAVESAGMDIQVGVMHTLDYAKPSLVLDLMEELRSPLCDRFVLNLINRKQITGQDFVREDGMIVITAEGKKKIISEWQKKKKEEIYHSEVNEKIEIGLIPYVQVKILSEYLREETEKYKPFIWR